MLLNKLQICQQLFLATFFSFLLHSKSSTSLVKIDFFRGSFLFSSPPHSKFASSWKSWGSLAFFCIFSTNFLLHFQHLLLIPGSASSLEVLGSFESSPHFKLSIFILKVLGSFLFISWQHVLQKLSTFTQAI